MRKKNLSLLFVLCLLVWGCKEAKVPLRAIHVTPESFQLEVQESQYVTAEPEPLDVDPGEMPFLWKSSNTKVAEVAASGLVKGVSPGKALITVSGRLSTSVTKNVSVTVIRRDIPLVGITVTPDQVTLEAGQFTQLKVTPDPADATDVTYYWLSDDPNVASVDSKGYVTGKAEGSTTITVTAATVTSNIEKRVEVTVTRSSKITIDNTSYRVDTLNYEALGEGIQWFKFRIPEFVNGFNTLGRGLVVNVVEVDLTYPDNRVEVWPAALRARDNRETPSAAYKRTEKAYGASGRKPVAAINGDFFLLDANNKTGYAYVNRRPLGMEVSNGMVVQTPYDNNNVAALIIRDDGSPEYTTQVSFSGKVEVGNNSFTLSEVNGFAQRGQLVLFNNQANSYASDSAFAWSPYRSTMVSLSYPEGGWRVNDRMEFTVTAIDYDVETTIPASSPYKGKSFNGEGAILVGSPTSEGLDNGAKWFLSQLKVGDKVGVTTEVKFNNKNVSDKRLHAIGFRGVMLNKGVVTNTWNEVHPRTAVGYSKDGKRVYLMVVDGRQNNYSVGATTGHLGDILKSLGAYTGVNLDGGGSSAMVVNGVTANKPSDGSERTVANGMMVVTKK
ncbi:MAG: phosphodiester glycosidase family protein [Bacteroidota bacterium]|nr:phosphodiester glycosidase family protein [Bacteroidota bacterium]